MLDGPRLAPLSGDRPTGLVVLVHGYGSNGDDLISLAAMIQPSVLAKTESGLHPERNSDFFNGIGSIADIRCPQEAPR